MADVSATLRDQLAKSRKSPDKGMFADDVMGGVSASWLSQAFGIPANTVRDKLRGCPVKGRTVGKAGRPTALYDLREAAPRLVPPLLGSRDYVRALKRNDLPPALTDQLWAGIIKRQKAELDAGMLWRTEDIRDVLANTFQTMKFEIQLWLETVERNTEMTDRQREIIVELSRGLQGNLFDALVKNEKLGNTGPILDTLLAKLGEATPINELLAEPDEEVEIEDETWEDLV